MPNASLPASLASRLYARWGQASDDEARGGVRVVAASAGTFKRRPGCATPRLWLLLVGHYRTFHYTQRRMAQMADASSDGCYMATAATSPELCLPRDRADDADAWFQVQSKDAHLVNSDGCLTWYKKTRPLPWPDWARSIDDVPSLLARAQQRTFDGRLAYIVMRRYGYLATRNGQGTEWHASWLAALWSQQVHGFAAAPESVLIRTRFDFHYDHAFELSALSAYFAQGPGGRHLAFVSRWSPDVRQFVPQTDVHLVTSYGSYSTDFGGALDRAELHRMAHANNWGVSWDYEEARDGSRCTGDGTSCYVTAMEAEPSLNSDVLLRNAPQGNASSKLPLAKVDLAERVHLLCLNVSAEWEVRADILRKEVPSSSASRGRLSLDPLLTFVQINLILT